MTMLKELQHQFLKQILGDKAPTIQQRIVKQGELSNDFRVSIYTNAYRMRLKECIETDHEILGIYLGDDLFDQMVEGYITHYPSQQTSLRYFAEQLPLFLAQAEPFKYHPVIAELAAFERNLLAAFDAADQIVSNQNDLACIAPEHWPKLIFKPHPSIRIFTAEHNSIEIWQALKQHISGHQLEIPTAIKLTPSKWLLWRNQDRLTEFKSMSPIETEVIQYILNIKSFADICQMLAEFYPSDVLEQNILNHMNMLIDNQLVTISA